MSDKKTAFEVLSEIDFSPYTKEVSKATYVPWSIVLREVLKKFPLMTWGVYEDKDGAPFINTAVGLFVHTWVQIAEEKQDAWLPVLNTAHKPLKLERYNYFVNEYKNGQRTGQMVEKWIEAADSFAVNTSIMRCAVKCFGFKGAGLHVYNDELKPEEETIDSAQLQQITGLCKQHGFRVGTIAQEFGGYPSIAKIPAARFENFMDWATPKEGN